VIRAFFALVAIGLIVSAIAAHVLGVQNVADYCGIGAYCAIVLALLAASVEAAVRKLKGKLE
jgi:hypothetical protein